MRVIIKGLCFIVLVLYIALCMPMAIMQMTMRGLIEYIEDKSFIKKLVLEFIVPESEK